MGQYYYVTSAIGISNPGQENSSAGALIRSNPILYYARGMECLR
jgi:hypothetical protein